MTSTTSQKSTVLVMGNGHQWDIPSLRQFKKYRNPNRIDISSTRDLFVLTTMAQLSQVSSFIKDAGKARKLRALLIGEDGGAQLLPQILTGLGLHPSSNMFVYSDCDIPNRVLHAWSVGAPDVLVATAHVFDDKLLVVSCAGETFELSFSQVRWLKAIPTDQRDVFEIDEYGSFIHWPAIDMHIDIDSIRYVTDEEFRKKVDCKRLTHDRRYGAAIARIRKSHGLKQTDIEGLSERQVRRIEKGERTVTVKSLERLADAHGMSLNDYLNCVSEAIHVKS